MQLGGRKAAGSGAAQQAPAPRRAALAAAPAPRPQQRGVGAAVFGTWRSPPLIGEAIGLRRFLDAAPQVAGSLVMPRLSAPGQHAPAQPAQQQRHEQEHLQQQLEQQQLQRAVPLVAEGKKPLRLSFAGSGVFFW
jgi:hypothetical protein